MEVVGRLAGGIAHDFNNLLTIIKGTADIALMDLPEGHPLREEFEHIQEAGNRAAQLTRQLLAFSRKQVLSPVALNLSTHVTNTARLLQRMIGEDITLVIEAGPELETVLADPGQIEQVILNLAVNARDAMPDGGSTATAAQPTTMPAKGTETILLAEDEDALRALATRMLRSSGYQVIATRSGEEALARLENHDGPMALLFTDVVMTGMTGVPLAREA